MCEARVLLYGSLSADVGHYWKWGTRGGRTFRKVSAAIDN
jgi:hypothetical protein